MLLQYCQCDQAVMSEGGREGFYWEHGVTLYLCVSHLQWRVTVVWILTKSYAHHFILFKAAAKVQGQIKHSISCPQINTQMIYAKMKTFFKIQTIIGYKSKALKMNISLQNKFCRIAQNN